jgi:uncharacterized membrane protein
MQILAYLVPDYLSLMAGTLLLVTLLVALFALTGLDGLLEAISEYWPLLMLMMFSEGFINGMCVSVLAIFFPDWLKTFDDHFYLDDA